MLTNAMKGISIVALLSAMVWHPSPSIQVLLQITVLAGSAFVIVQCFNLEKWAYGVVFIAMAVLFAAVTTPWPSRPIFLWLDGLCLFMFGLSLIVLKTQPRLSIASITDRTPRTESL